jgi:hypothetical protein
MNLISLVKPHQSIDVTILSMPSLNFLTIIRFQICAIPLAQLAKNVYKLIKSYCLHNDNAHPLDDFIEVQYY